MVYDIAIGNSRRDKTPKSYMWEWQEIVERLRNVTYGEHNTDVFQRMEKRQQVDAKDVGYFIGGNVDKRKVLYRQLLVLDIDYCDSETLPNLRAWLLGKSYVIHSTHSSTPENPRYRVVIPLNTVVKAEMHGAMMRILYDKFNLPLDISTFDFNRIMFLPSIPKDAEYFFETETGEPLDVDGLLNEVDDWKDLSEVEVPKTLKVKDPLLKGGIVGAFCNRISIYEAMDTYLTDVWTKEPNGRYTIRDATTVGGGIIYEDKFLYSNHSSDKFLGRCHNAYDAVRLYKFGDGKTGEGLMAAFCKELGIEPDSGKAHKLTLDRMEDEEAKAILLERLEVDTKGNIIKSLKNAELILRYDPELSNLFAYDMFSEMPVLKRTPPWRSYDIVPENEDCKNVIEYTEMEDVDESFLRLRFQELYNFDAKGDLTDALRITQYENKFHPIRDYLNSLVWDGVPRLERIFIDCFGVEDTLYTREVGLKFFVGAVRRVFYPASKMDYIPVLVSDEGYQKSRFIRRMGKNWGSDTFYTFNGGKEAYEQLRGVWIMEIPELDGVQKRSSNSRKAFVTKKDDRYRAAYLKYTKTYKRQCVFIASSNDVVFLDDPNEGGRRWWGLMCRREHITIDVGSEEFLDLVDKYWAEAVYHFQQGVLPMLSPKAEEEATQMRQVHKSEDTELGALMDYLNMPVPLDWREQTVEEHVMYWRMDRIRWVGTPRDYICVGEVAREFFEYSRKELTTTTHLSRKTAEAIRRTGLFKQQAYSKRFGSYGSCNAWERVGIEKVQKPVKRKAEKKTKTKKKKE